MHYGMDIVGKENKSILSCTSGTVTKIGNSSARGKYVWVESNDGFGLIYQHLSSIRCELNQNVSPGTVIGIEGSTGNSSGSHLHLGVYTTSNPSLALGNEATYAINPAPFLGIDGYSRKQLIGKVFEGKGTITGYSVDKISTNNDTDASNTSEVGTLIPSGEYYKAEEITAVYSDWLYGRRYRIIIDLGSNGAFDISELRCEFEIIKTSYQEANQSVVTIYNLNPQDENKIIKNGQRVVIEAGYAGAHYGKIFDGNIIQPLRYKENGVDYKLTLICMDSERYIQYGLISVSAVAEQTSRDVINILTEKSAVKTEKGFISDTNIKYPRGKVMFGRASDYLSQLAKSENAFYYNEDGSVNIVKPKDLVTNEIFDLSPQSGLIGTPIQMQQSIQCECLLNPLIKTNMLFHIDNSVVKGRKYQQGQYILPLDAEGIYRVIKFTHSGDTRGDDWKTTIEAVTQSGMLPGMVLGDSVYIG